MLQLKDVVQKHIEFSFRPMLDQNENHAHFNNQCVNKKIEIIAWCCQKDIFTKNNFKTIKHIKKGENIFSK